MNVATRIDCFWFNLLRQWIHGQQLLQHHYSNSMDSFIGCQYGEWMFTGDFSYSIIQGISYTVY